VIRHHFQLGNVITTVDVVNAELHLSRNREGIKQVAAADRLVLTKSDLAEPEQTAAVRDELARLNPSARLWDAAEDPVDADFLLDVMPSGTPPGPARYRLEEEVPRELGSRRTSRPHRVGCAATPIPCRASAWSWIGRWTGPPSASGSACCSTDMATTCYG